MKGDDLPILYRRLRLLASVLAVSLLISSQSPAQHTNAKEIVVAAAADLSSALRDVADNYEKKTGVAVKL